MPKISRKRLLEETFINVVDKAGKRIKSVFGKSIQIGVSGDSEFNRSSLTINNYTFPTSDGSNTQVIKTDGAGTLYWDSLSDSGIAVYKVNSSGTQITAAANIGDPGTDDFIIPYDTAVIANTNVVSSNSSGTLTLNSTDSSVFKITVYTIAARQAAFGEGSDKFRMQIEAKKSSGDAGFTEIYDGTKQTISNLDTSSFEFLNSVTYLSTTGTDAQVKVLMVRDLGNIGPTYLQTVTASDCTITIEKF